MPAGLSDPDESTPGCPPPAGGPDDMPEKRTVSSIEDKINKDRSNETTRWLGKGFGELTEATRSHLRVSDD